MAAATTLKKVLLLCVLLITCLFVPSLSLPTPSCADFVFPTDGKVFTSCADLPALNSFLHWTHNPSSGSLHVAFRHAQVTPSTWVAWGINPTSAAMVGTQAIIAYQKPDGTMAVFTSPVNSYRTLLQNGSLSFPVSDLSATFANDEIVLYATMNLSLNNGSLVNHVWQDGPVSGDTLRVHDLSGLHLQSIGTLNLSSGQVMASHGHGGDFKIKLKAIHGALNTVSWGVMMPLGFMAARYLKAVGPTADPLWFYVHISLQLPGFVIGMVGGATGLLLGSKSSGIHHPCHMGIGITMFCLGLFQISAMILRPAKDRKLRYVWNWFHHIIGYTVILLGFANIWLGFNILKPAKEWVIAYGVIFGVLIFVTLLLEVWKKLTRDRKKIDGVDSSAVWNDILKVGSAQAQLQKATHAIPAKRGPSSGPISGGDASLPLKSSVLDVPASLGIRAVSANAVPAKSREA
ncbi:hypothetical protein U1Q18_012063 [Sarracenia purpurea var. burkii]